MSERTLKRILGIVALLVVIYAAVALFSHGPSTGGGGGTDALHAFLSSLGPDQVDGVSFIQQSDTIRLWCSVGSWTVNGYPADSARVARFWEGLADAEVTGPAARNPANHARMGVTEDSALQVVFHTPDGQDQVLLVGHDATPGPSAYVRLPDQDPVDVLHGDIRREVRRTVATWRDPTVEQLDTTRLRTIVLNREDSHQTLQRSDSAWTVDGQPADSLAVSGIVSGLAMLRSTGFAPDSATLTSPDRTLVALGAGGDTLTALSLKMMPDSANYRVKARDRDQVYELTTYQVGRLFPDTAVLKGH